MPFWLLFGAIMASACAMPAQADFLRVGGSAVATAPLAAAVVPLHAVGLDLKIAANQSSTTALAALVRGDIDLAVVTRAVTAEEHARAPELFLEANPIAYQIIALVVPSDVWESGVKALSREQAQQIYERDLLNWKEAGGADRAIKFFNPEPGRGLWELFVTWIYGDSRKADLGEQFETVSTTEQTRNLVEFTPGALSVAALGRIEERSLHPLALKDDAGEIRAPTVAEVRAQTYPLGRRIDLVSAQRPSGKVLRLIEFMRGPEGRALLKEQDCLPWEEQ